MPTKYKESDMILTINTLRTNPHLKISHVTQIFHVPRTTLSDRVKGKSSRQNILANSRKLTNLEEEVIVRYILDLDSRAFPPRRSNVEDMANRILFDRNGGRVGKNWTTNFVRRQPDLRTRFNRTIDYQRVLCEDPDAFKAWFRLVRNTIDKYGIVEEDIYNFDETGFLMGQICSEMVITSAERQNRPRTAQQGNREWVTVIQGVSSDGFTVPPYIIVAGKNHLSTWSYDSPLPRDWRIAVTSNGWTTNERGLDWLRHFENHTRLRTKGTYRLLILDGYESHHSTDFELLCKENNIITLCMPPHSSHKLQPLDVGCFRALKRSYGAEIEKLMRVQITYISKEDFFPAFHTAFRTALTELNIRGGFRGSGLVPYDPEYVISQLEVIIPVSRLSTATSLPPPWVPSTPQNSTQTTLQSSYVREQIVRHQNSSPTAILQGIEQLAKGAQRAIHELVILRAEVISLREANHTLSRRRRTKKRRLQEGGSLTIGESQDLQVRTNPRSQLQVIIKQNGDRLTLSPTQRQCCTGCGEAGHNIRTCQNKEEIGSKLDSD